MRISIGLRSEWRKNKTLVLMLVPASLFFFIFSYLPMAGAVLAFKSYQFDQGIFGSPWVGFRNFDFFFLSGKAWLLTANTVLYNVAFIVTGMISQIIVAIFIAELGGKWFKKIAQSVMFLPFFISFVVVGAFVYNIFNYEFGTLNNILVSMGFEKVDVYSTPEAWKYILIFFNIWKYVGYGSIIFLASIVAINQELYESADIDGASIFQKARHITLPLLKPIIIILVLLQVGHIMRGNFDLFFQLVGYNGLLFDATDVIDTYVFRTLTTSTELGLPAAAGLFQNVIGFIIIMVVNYTVKKVNQDYALF